MKSSQTPKRWTEAKSSAPPGIAQWLSSVKPTRDMSEAEYARSLSRVAGLLHPGAAGGGSGTGGAGPGSGTGSAGASAKLGAAGAAKAKVAAALLGLAALGGGVLWHDSSGDSTPATTLAQHQKSALPALTRSPKDEPVPPQEGHPGTVVDVNALPDAVDGSSERNSKVPAAQPSTSAAPEAQATEPDTLGEEIRLIGAAERMVERDPKTALSYLEQHAQLFPEGKLRNDRMLLKARALVRLNRHSEARDIASTIPPESLLGAKARKSLESP